MIRQVITIDQELCNGCGACVSACHEGAIGMKDGKAYLTRDDYCDGLGDCLPSCPVDAITFETREALPFDEEAVKLHMEKMKQPSGCPSCVEQQIQPKVQPSITAPMQSQLQSWPVQIQLVNPQAAFFNNAHLLIAADCSAYAYANFHQEFMRNKVTIIGCPKLDLVNYSEKLLQILLFNNIKSVTVVRMEVPCCGGLSHAAITALQQSQKMIPWHIVTISTDGEIIED